MSLERLDTSESKNVPKESEHVKRPLWKAKPGDNLNKKINDSVMD